MCAQTPSLDALATSPHSALFWRFYSAAGVCSPTRAAYLTGRTNERSCIHFALTCDSENPAEECSQGPGLPWSEFTTAKAVKKAGGFKSIMIGKWRTELTALKAYCANRNANSSCCIVAKLCRPGRLVGQAQARRSRWRSAPPSRSW